MISAVHRQFSVNYATDRARVGSTTHCTEKVSVTRFMCWCIDSIELNHPRTLSSRVGRWIYFSAADSFGKPFVCSHKLRWRWRLPHSLSNAFGFALKFAHELLDYSSNSIISDKLLMENFLSFVADFSRWENFREKIALMNLSTLNRRRKECLEKW